MSIIFVLAFLKIKLQQGFPSCFCKVKYCTPQTGEFYFCKMKKCVILYGVDLWLRTEESVADNVMCEVVFLKLK
jgi:hypothetical protein